MLSLDSTATTWIRLVGLLTNAEIDSCAQTEGKFQVVLHVIYDLDLAI
jgi:hypothetical protein